MRIAWIGTGIMKALMARRLLRADHNSKVFNLMQAEAQALAINNAVVAETYPRSAGDAEVIFTMLPETHLTRRRFIEQVTPTLTAGALVIDVSTIVVSPPIGKHSSTSLPSRSFGISLGVMYGEGRLFKRGRIWRIAYRRGGKEYRESSGGTDERVAREFLNARLGAPKESLTIYQLAPPAA